MIAGNTQLGISIRQSDVLHLWGEPVSGDRQARHNLAGYSTWPSMATHLWMLPCRSISPQKASRLFAKKILLQGSIQRGVAIDGQVEYPARLWRACRSCLLTLVRPTGVERLTGKLEHCSEYFLQSCCNVPEVELLQSSRS